MTREPPANNLRWVRRLEVPYPMLSDADGEAARALGVTRELSIAGWRVDLARRVTLLVDAKGTIAAVWSRVRVRGHAADVLRMARTLSGAD